MRWGMWSGAGGTTQPRLCPPDYPCILTQFHRHLPTLPPPNCHQSSIYSPLDLHCFRAQTSPLAICLSSLPHLEGNLLPLYCSSLLVFGTTSAPWWAEPHFCLMAQVLSSHCPHSGHCTYSRTWDLFPWLMHGHPEATGPLHTRLAL